MNGFASLRENSRLMQSVYRFKIYLNKSVGKVNLLAYDYEGYGKASGTPSEKACYNDIMYVNNGLRTLSSRNTLISLSWNAELLTYT